LQTMIARLVQSGNPVIIDEAGDLEAAAVFDPANWRGLFADDEAEGRRWLAAFLAAASEFVQQIDLLAAACGRDAIAAEAHKLASASLGVGAMRLGLLARQLETTAHRAPAQELRRLAETVAAAQRDASVEIGRCLAVEEAIA
jgi:HPt (histidine-containing phosphotransfer) domain-containing protein